MLKRIGLYYWAGPGTERIIQTKYFYPIMDHVSFQNAYTYESLARLKELFGITDAWISYSWGFSDEKEKADYAFTLKNLSNFAKLGIKTHAYLQGCNLVYQDFKDQDFWCRDEQNRLVTYYKGRIVTCVNNPNFRAFFKNRLISLSKKPFDGVFIDNIQMGQLGIPTIGNKLPYVFTGCRCTYCQAAFKNQYQEEIPIDLETNITLTQKYLKFRVDSLHNFIEQSSRIVHANKKEFGTNSYDPKFNTRNIYGFDVLELQKNQDYLLFENHTLKDDSIDNAYIDQLKLTKPVFVVSYQKGIGYDSQYSQKSFNLIFSEANKSNFFPLLKASEFKTHGIWHTLKLKSLQKPSFSYDYSKKKNVIKTSIKVMIFENKIFRFLAKKYYNQIYTLVMENKYARPLMSVVYEFVLH